MSFAVMREVDALRWFDVQASVCELKGLYNLEGLAKQINAGKSE